MKPIAQTYRPRLILGQFAMHIVLLFFSLLTLAPFAVLLSASFSSEAALGRYGYSLLPRDFSLAAYQFLLADPSQLLRSYGVSVTVTLVGGGLGLLIMSLLAYALSRHDFGLRMPLAFFVFFTMLFNGGLVPWYMLISQYLHLRNTIWVLILPHLVVPWYILLLRTYFANLPTALLDAARIDGAGEWRIFFGIALPLSTPALATVGLFHVLSYWNDWWLALLFIDDRSLAPLQYLLYIIQSNIDAVANDPTLLSSGPIPSQAVRMAMVVLAIGPIAFAFLFAQKYFARGVVLGGMKGD